MPTPLHIIDLLDLLSITGYLGRIEREPGRHGLSNAGFLDIRDPDDPRIESRAAHLQRVDPDLGPNR